MEGLERSSGAPGTRVGAAGIAAVATAGGGSLASVLAPRGRGAPGAVGLRAGSNASPRRAPEKLGSVDGADDADAGTEGTAAADCGPEGGYALPAGGYCEE